LIDLVFVLVKKLKTTAGIVGLEVLFALVKPEDIEKLYGTQ